MIYHCGDDSCSEKITHSFFPLFDTFHVVLASGNLTDIWPKGEWYDTVGERTVLDGITTL